MAINRNPTAATPAAPGNPATPTVATPPPPAPRVAPPTPGTAAAAKPAVLYRLPSGVQGTFICAVTVGGGTKYSFATGAKPELLDAEASIVEVPTTQVSPPDAPSVKVSKKWNIVDEVPAAPAVEVPAVVTEKPIASETVTDTVLQLGADLEDRLETALQPPAPAPAKRGRPAGAKNKPKVEVPEVEAEPCAVTHDESSTPAADVRLYFSCSPLGVATSTLHRYVEQLERAVITVANQNGASKLIPGDDIRLATGEFLGFGRYKAYLAAAVKEQRPEPGHYVVDRGSDERLDCVADALAAVLPAGCVVRGGR